MNRAVGAEIRAWLGRRGKTQRWLSEELELSAMGVSRRLKGEIPFRIDELLRVAPALGISLGQLLGEELVNEKNPHPMGEGSSSSERTSVAGARFELATSGLTGGLRTLADRTAAMALMWFLNWQVPQKPCFSATRNGEHQSGSRDHVMTDG